MRIGARGSRALLVTPVTFWNHAASARNSVENRIPTEKWHACVPRLRAAASARGIMFKLFCEGCVVALVVGSAFRFAMLAHGLSAAKMLAGELESLAAWRKLGRQDARSWHAFRPDTVPDCPR